MRASTGRLERQREVSGRVGEDQRSCQHCGKSLAGRRPLVKFCSRLCSRHAWEAVGKAQRAVALADEQAAEVADARQRLVELALRLERLAPAARGDSPIRCELETIRSMIRCAQARLEQDAEEGTAA
jgi:hypothetical protein